MMNSALLGQNIKELPTKRFAQQCRVVAQNVNDILVAIKLGNIPEWKQLFTDGTSDSFFLIQGTHTCCLVLLILLTKSVLFGSFLLNFRYKNPLYLLLDDEYANSLSRSTFLADFENANLELSCSLFLGDFNYANL